MAVATDQNLKCFYCRADVSAGEHRNVQVFMQFVLDGNLAPSAYATALEENTFIHMTPVADECDYDGNVVVCALDFVREVSEQLFATAYPEA